MKFSYVLKIIFMLHLLTFSELHSLKQRSIPQPSMLKRQNVMKSHIDDLNNVEMGNDEMNNSDQINADLNQNNDLKGRMRFKSETNTKKENTQAKPWRIPLDFRFKGDNYEEINLEHTENPFFINSQILTSKP